MTAARASAILDRPAAHPARGPADQGVPERRGRRHLPTVVGVVAAVGCGTWGLGRLSLWLDEATSLGATAQLGATFRGSAGTMATYYLLLDGWTALVGTTPTALRSLSVLIAALVVVAWAPLARRLLPPVEAATSVVLLGALPALARYAQEARSYTLLALVVVLGWICVERAVVADAGGDARRATRWWVALAVVSVVGVGTHGLYPLQLVAMVGSLLALPERRRLVRAALPAIVATVATVGWLATMGAGDIATWVPPLRLGQLVDLGAELLAPSLLPALVLGGLAVGGAATLVRRATPDPVARWRALALVVWAAGPPALLVLVSVGRPYLIPRYVIGSVPAIAALVAVGAVALVRRPGGSERARAVAVGTVVVAALIAGQVTLHQRTSYDWRGAAGTVAEGVQPGDAMLMSSPPLRMAFEAAWREVDAPTTPELLGFTRPLGEVRRADVMTSWADLDAALARADRVWMVHQTTKGLQDRARDLLLDRASLRDGFEIVRHRHYDGGVQVLLLERT